MTGFVWSAVAERSGDTALGQALNGSLLIFNQTTISKAVSPLRSATALQMNKLIECLDREFAQLNLGSRELIRNASPALLYRKVPSGSGSLYSFGEHILRSAATVEQTFGGLTANLWDDPFEWTLPETLSTPEKVAGYLDEVEVTRKHGFELFKSDDDLLKEILAPVGEMQLLPLLLDTLVRAVHYQGKAFATFDIVRGQQSEKAR